MIYLLQNYINTLTKHYATFKGRVNRKEYAGDFLLVYYILQLLPLLAIRIYDYNLFEQAWKAMLARDIDALAQLPKMVRFTLLVAVLIYFVHLLPALGASVRRGHDIGISGWLAVPLYCFGGMIILALFPGKSKPNKYGDVPAKKDPVTLAPFVLLGIYYYIPCM